MDTTPPSLLARIKDPEDGQSWSVFFSAYAPFIFRVAKSQGLQHEDAEEVVQQVMVAVVKQIPEFDYDPKRGRFRSWLQTITRRRIADLMQLRARSLTAYQASLNNSEVDLDPFFSAWEDQWQQTILEESLQQARSKVGPQIFQAFWCRAIKGWSSKETANFLELTVNQVNVYKHRVLGLVREHSLRLLQEARE